MTAIVTDYLSTKIVRHLLGFETLPVVTNLRLALYSTSEGIQTDTPTGELTDVNYEKHAVVFTELGVSEPFHFPGFATEVSIAYQALVGTMEGVDRILIATACEPVITPLIGQPLWYEAGKVSLELLAVD